LRFLILLLSAAGELCVLKFTIMDTLQHPYAPFGFAREAKKTIAHRFIDWCTAQEKNRILWLAIIVMGHGCIITPLTILINVFTSNSMLAWAFAIAAMTMSLVTNLAALPTKITIPIFFLSLVIDIAVVVSCIAAVFSA
jgi:hypothetical protein